MSANVKRGKTALERERGAKIKNLNSSVPSHIGTSSFTYREPTKSERIRFTLRINVQRGQEFLISG